MNYNITYIFRLVDQFSGGALAMAATAQRLSSALTSVGVAAAGLAAIGGVFGNAVAEAAKFEDKMSEVRKVVPDMTKDMMWKMGDEVMRLAAWSGVAKNEIAELFASGARMGIRGTDALSQFAETVTKVKVAWDGVSASMAGETMGRIAGQFFGDLDQVEAQKRMLHVADAINYLGQNIAGAKPLEQLKFFQRAGSMFNETGMTAEETAAWAATAISSGVAGSDEGTRATASLLRLKTKALFSKPGAKGFEELGWSRDEFLRLREAEGPLAAIMGIMERVRALNVKTGSSDASTSAISKILGDARAARQFLAMANQINKMKQALASVDTKWAQKFLQDADFVSWLEKNRPDELERLRTLTPLGKTLSQGSVDLEFQARMETLLQQSNRLSEAWSNLWVQIGKPALEPLTALVSKLATATQALSDFAGANRDVAKAIGYMVGALAGLTTGVLLGKVAAWAFGVKSALAGLMLLGGSVLTITLAAAVIGAGAWIISNWETFWKAVSKPINIEIRWPEAPDWLKWLAGGRDRELRAQEAFRRYGFEDDAYVQRFAMPSSAAAFAEAMSENARRAAAGNPFAQFPGVATPGDMRSLWQRMSGADAAWTGRDSLAGAQLASAIPQSVAISVTSDVRLLPGELNVTYNGPIGGPPSVGVDGQASRGTTMPTVGGGGSPGGIGQFGNPDRF